MIFPMAGIDQLVETVSQINVHGIDNNNLTNNYQLMKSDTEKFSKILISKFFLMPGEIHLWFNYNINAAKMNN